MTWQGDDTKPAAVLIGSDEWEAIRIPPRIFPAIIEFEFGDLARDRAASASL